MNFHTRQTFILLLVSGSLFNMAAAHAQSVTDKGTPAALAQEIRRAMIVQSSPQTIENLIQQGADVNDATGGAPLVMEAAQEAVGQNPHGLAYVRLLLRNGAKADADYDARTALRIAASSCNLELTQTLLQYGADPDFSPPGWKIHVDAKYMAKISQKNYGSGPRYETCGQVRAALDAASDENFIQRWGHSIGRGWANVMVYDALTKRAVSDIAVKVISTAISAVSKPPSPPTRTGQGR